MSASIKSAEAVGKRAHTKAVNRQAILAAARQVFARLGFESTTVRDIIRETNLAAGTFYNYFKSKEEVFEALANESGRQFRPRLQDVRQSADNFEQYIEKAYRAYFEFLNAANEEAISEGAPHIALIGVRVDTPEMHAIFDEIRMDMERVTRLSEMPLADSEYLTAAAIGIARDLGDHMLQRRPVDVDGATRFATSLLLNGVQSLTSGRRKP
ncbi:TetR/AcrR family transcriptional regulator [Henriciella litoralis]|uniref:TetR/AcrR family transcriptional regulator n=1 Tax=Henriciella litoralis TaxID=568102 RepID=UPI0009FD7A34|nr:TetR/AcrR family transcriptional regulator [Henriciella litoralis]